MKSFFFKLLLLISIFVMSSGDLFAQYTWTKYTGNPVIPSGPSGSWYRGVITPCVIYNADSSRYEMWFAGSPTTTGLRPHRIGFAYSSDGISWQVRTTAVLEPRSGNWDNYTVNAPYVIRENSQYKMWYTAEGPNYTTFKIGYATSPDGINWTRLDNPIMDAGTAEWEAQGVGICSVLPVTGGYKMWYSGLAGSTDTISIGYAVSTDGINWQRDTVHNPILRPGTAGQWDDFNIFAPRIIVLDNVYYMYYGASRQTFAQYRVGLATSTDGINWEKYWDNPVLRPSPSGWDNGEVETACIIKIGNTLKLWYDASNSGTYHWQIGLATSTYYPNALAPGTYTVGTGGNFATIQDAFNKLETDGVAGNVTLELTDDLYTAPTDSFGFKLNGPIPGAGPSSRVTIKPAENKNVVIEGAGFNVFRFDNTSYLTLDGVDNTGQTTLTIHGDPQYDWLAGVNFTNNSDYNEIKHMIITIENKGFETDGIFIWTVSGSETSDNNIVQNNFIKSADVGIIVAGQNQNTKATGNIVSGNKIGSETDSLITIGIGTWALDNSIIENNIVQNLRQQPLAYWNISLNPGISLSFSSNSIIRNNVVHNIKANSLQGCTGIWVAGDGVNGYGNDNLVYNNMVYDIQSTSTQFDSRVSGIQLWYQNNPKVYYNSVSLSGTGANKYGSAALYITSNVSDADIKNNILVNTRDESPYCASAIYDYTAANLTSDYNDLYYDETNNNNCLVRIGSAKYNTLADWQATTQDLHSYVEMPHFMSSTNLHIDETIATYLESRGIPIAGIDTDFDGDQRNPDSTDIGADEFDGIYKVTGVENELGIPTEFALEQNYPNPFNPSTKISWQLPVGSQQTLKIYDVLGNEIMTLIDEYKPAGRYEIEFNSHSGEVRNLPSGVYFYQLKVYPAIGGAGDYISTKKMILLK
jgi:predicted GH43/DUF377 family glycosyl hydrolase